MAIDQDKLIKLIAGAGRLVGIKEILRVGEFNPGLQTELKRVLRDLVKAGALVRDGKRFGVAGDKPAKKSGRAWTESDRSRGEAVLSQGKKPARELPQGKGRFRRAWGEGFVREEPRREAKRRGGDESAAPRKGPPKTRETHGQLVQGIIHHHRDGFAFVKPIVGQQSEDIFVPPEEAARALDHDQVVVEILPGRGGRTMGRLVEVKSRTRQLVVGTYFENDRGAFVKPREAELGAIKVPPTQLARPGDAVKVRLGIGEALLGRDQLTGEVAGSLGSPDDHSVEVLSVAFAKGFHDEFPPEVMDEADVIPISVSDAEAGEHLRRDLRELPLVTIDGEDARDFDDAIYVEPHKGGGWRLVVAIADVAHYVKERTALDAEALRRATSVYLPGRVLPMLPERLSNGICSLRPDVDRLCMVADMVIDRHGATLDTELYPAVMKSHARCTYTEVHKVLAGEHVPGRTELKRLFENANTLAKTLTRMRMERGAIDFDLPEHRVELDERGLPVRMVARERWESHRLVEECMLAANEAVARFFREQGVPTVNRYHGDPDEERLATFVGLLQAYGIEVPSDELTSKQLNAVLKKLEGHPEQRALHQLALRSMMQAVYSSQQAGHYGLGAEDYLHFTSPIRRYPDLLVHRLLKAFWSRKKKPAGQNLEAEGERLEALAVQCSERERAAMQVEREVNALYSCLLMKDRLGEEFEGTICGLSENGFFVELDELHVEGFVRGETIFPDFEFDQSTYRIEFGNGRAVKVGMKARVLLLSVNLQRKQIEFSVVELEQLEARQRFGEEPTDGGRRGGVQRERGKSRERGAWRERSRESKGGRTDWRKDRQERGERGERQERPGRPGRQEQERQPERSDWKKVRGGVRGGERKQGKVSSRRYARDRSEPSAPVSDPRLDRWRSGKLAPQGQGEPEAKPFTPSLDRFRTARGDGQAPAERPHQVQRHEKQRSPQPPPQPWDKPAEEAQAQEEAAPKTFDPRQVLDRLWRERGGRGPKR